MKVKAVVALLCCLIAAAAVWAQADRYVAEIRTDVSRDESILHVRVLEPIQAGRAIWIEPRDGGLRESYEVRHVFDEHVFLESRLKSDFVGGSRIFQ